MTSSNKQNVWRWVGWVFIRRKWSDVREEEEDEDAYRGSAGTRPVLEQCVAGSGSLAPPNTDQRWIILINTHTNFQKNAEYSEFHPMPIWHGKLNLKIHNLLWVQNRIQALAPNFFGGGVIAMNSVFGWAEGASELLLLHLALGTNIFLREHPFSHQIILRNYSHAPHLPNPKPFRFLNPNSKSQTSYFSFDTCIYKILMAATLSVCQNWNGHQSLIRAPHTKSIQIYIV